MAGNFLGLACSECKRVLYMRVASTRKKGVERPKLETKKFCKFCRKHTLHKETKWPKG